MSVIQNRALRFILFSVGALSLILGFIGAFLPVLPTTPFVLLAAGCFVKCSPKAHQWIYRQRLIGPALKNWEENRAISRRSKLTAISMIAISAIVIGFQVQILWLEILVLLILATVSIFIATRNEKTNKGRA
jgi:uncharacterized membrane protein YbaN (DUF454 family)